MQMLRPADAAETAQMVAWAAAEEQPLEVLAGGSKRNLGRPTHASHTLDLSALDGIVDYAPSELVLTARAATPMAAIQDQLDAHRQMLAFEPPDWGALLQTDRAATLGGVIACNQAGPRRVRAGAARDHFLGFAAINGWGDPWKAGGRVVKNVTGYDLCKLQAGAYGTLSILTEVSVKVLPAPESSCTVLLRGLDAAAAVRQMALALNTPHEVSAAAHLPAEVAARTGLAASGEAATVLRLEGPHPSVVFRAAALDALLGDTVRLDEADSVRLWRQIGAVQPLLDPTAAAVWRICPTPSAAAVLLQRLTTLWPEAQGFMDWAGGLLWFAMGAADIGEDAGAALLRAEVAAVGGHATLVRAPENVRAQVPVFPPQAGALADLTRRVKASFDPRRILNRGRIHEDS